MKRLLLALLFVPGLASGQWSNGTNLWPSTPLAVGDMAHPSIAFGVRCLFAFNPCDNLHGAGQRGISSEAIYNEEATVYVAGVHSQLVFRPGTYTVPLAMGMRVVTPVVPAGVTVSQLHGLKIYDQTQGQSNYAIYTGLGKVSLGDVLELRGQPGYRSITVQNGSIISLYDATGAEVGRIQGAGGDVLITALTGKVRIPSLAGAGTRALSVDSQGNLVAQ